MKRHPIVNFPQDLAVWPAQQTPFASPEDESFPTLTLYLPSEEHRTGQSVLLLPGGGYGLVSTAKEGHRPAQFLCAHGIAAGVLEYRHSPQRHPVPLVDAQRGIRLLRNWAGENGLDTGQIGVMGFSAGGHLAGCVATQPDVKEGLIGVPLDSVSSAPDFAVMMYPVVSLTESWAHTGSRNNLLGQDADPDLAETLSIEKAVTPETPPMFIFHTQEDKGVPVENSLQLYRALTKCGVASDLHVYAKGAHGFGLDANHEWGTLLVKWLEGLRG